MEPNTNVSVTLTSELRLEQALQEVGVEDPASVRELAISGEITEADFAFIRKNMDETLQEVDISKASIEVNRSIFDAYYVALFGCSGLTVVFCHDGEIIRMKCPYVYKAYPNMLRKAVNNFLDTAEKWDTFSRLALKHNEIINDWWAKLQTEIVHREQNNGMSDWDIFSWDNLLIWHIKGESEHSLSVQLWARGYVYLRVYYSYVCLSISKVDEICKSKFDAIKSCFDRVDESEDNTIGRENGNFSFGCDYDGHFPDITSLAWYAGNRTEEFADQIIAKVRKFQTPEMTALFKEINEKCRKIQ